MKIRYSVLAFWLLSIAGSFALAWAVKPSRSTSTESTTERPGLSSIPGRADAGGGGSKRSARSAEFGDAASTPSHLAEYMASGTISAEAMATAIADMRRENDPIKKRAMFSQLLEQLTPENAKSGLLALRERRGDNNRFGRGGGGGGGDEERLLLNAWGRIDGAGAIAELQAMDDARRAEREAEAVARGEQPGEGGNNRGRGGDRGFGGFDIGSVLSGWATADASGAMDYVSGIEDERMKGMMGGSVVRGLMVNGVDEAVSYISALPADDENRRRHMSAVAEEVLEDGAAGAAKWVDGLSDDGLKEGAMRRIAESYARENLDDAISWVGQHQGEAYASSAVTQIAERWAENDPQAVLDWAADLPEDTQKGVFQEALDEWTERDEVAASEYLAQMEASPVKDSAVRGFATELSRKDPESAATWAATIEDPDIRTETITRVAGDWMRSDRTAAEAWLPTSGLSVEQQQQVTAGGGRGGFGNRGGGRGR